jgi:hypothetical protein
MRSIWEPGAAQDSRHPLPLLVVEECRHDRTVEVLDGSAPGLGPGQLDASQVAQDARVVADGRQRLIKEAGELDRTGLAALRQDLQDAPAQRVCKRLDQGFVQRMRHAHTRRGPYSAAGGRGAPSGAARLHPRGHWPLRMADSGSIGRSSVSMFTRFTSLMVERGAGQ